MNDVDSIVIARAQSTPMNLKRSSEEVEQKQRSQHSLSLDLGEEAFACNMCVTRVASALHSLTFGCLRLERQVFFFPFFLLPLVTTVSTQRGFLRPVSASVKFQR